MTTAEHAPAALAPVVKTVTVNTTPERAFAIFTAQMGRWWLRTHTINAVSPIADVVMEPRAGGRWYERGEDGSEAAWGKVLAWEPPTRVLLAWQINGAWTYDPALITEVEVRFTPLADGKTRVDLEHRNIERYGDSAAQARAALDSPGGWAGLLAGFVAATG